MNTDVIALTLEQLKSIPLVQAFNIVSTIVKVIESTRAAIITINTSEQATQNIPKHQVINQ